MYLATFDKDGKRTASYILDRSKNIPSDAIPISDEDQDKYVTGLYYRQADGTPALIPPYVPTAEEIKKQEIDILDAEYQPQFTELSQALGMAMLAENTDLITSIKADYVKLKAEYDAKRGEING